MALPPDAVLEATLEDISRADAPAKVIGRVRIEKPGNPPIPFEIAYDPSRTDSNHRYVVRARILVADRPLFTAARHAPVLAGGQGKEVALLLRRASPSGPAGRGASLEDTSWRLIRLGDMPVAAPSSARQPFLILDPKTRRVAGSGGCNRLTGSYEVKGDRLTFRETASTMMACIEGMDTEKAFVDALPQVKTWRIEGQELEFFDDAGKMFARFETRR